MAKRTTDNGKRVLFIVHRKELCDQIRNTFSRWGVDMELCEIGMVQTASFNIASDVVGFKPIRLDEIISKYPLKNVPNIHRITIDNASRKEVKDAWILMDT